MSLKLSTEMQFLFCLHFFFLFLFSFLRGILGDLFLGCSFILLTVTVFFLYTFLTSSWASFDFSTNLVVRVTYWLLECYSCEVKKGTVWTSWRIKDVAVVCDMAYNEMQNLEREKFTCQHSQDVWTWAVAFLVLPWGDPEQSTGC